MSKVLEAKLTCPACGQVFEAKVHRTLWIEEPKNREMLFGDEVNVFTCPKCGRRTPLTFGVFFTNSRLKFAVWYAPEPDPVIDEDVAGYRKMFGQDHYLASAPRLRTMAEVKAKVLELEDLRQKATIKPTSPELAGAAKMLHGFSRFVVREGQVSIGSPWVPICFVGATIPPLAGILLLKENVSVSSVSVIVAALGAGLWYVRARVIPWAEWLLWNTGFEVQKSDRLRAHRLGHVVGMVAGVVSGSELSGWAEDLYRNPRIPAGLVAAGIGYLAGVVLTRALFWSLIPAEAKTEPKISGASPVERPQAELKKALPRPAPAEPVPLEFNYRDAADFTEKWAEALHDKILVETLAGLDLTDQQKEQVKPFYEALGLLKCTTFAGGATALRMFSTDPRMLLSSSWIKYLGLVRERIENLAAKAKTASVFASEHNMKINPRDWSNDVQIAEMFFDLTIKAQKGAILPARRDGKGAERYLVDLFTEGYDSKGDLEEHARQVLKKMLAV